MYFLLHSWSKPEKNVDPFLEKSVEKVMKKIPLNFWDVPGAILEKIVKRFYEKLRRRSSEVSQKISGLFG